MGPFCHKVPPTGLCLVLETPVRIINVAYLYLHQSLRKYYFYLLQGTETCLTGNACHVFIFIVGICFAGVPEQASDLGVGPVPAHGAGHGHREHPALRWLQQTEHYAGRESQLHTDTFTST